MAYDGLWICSQVNYYQKNLIGEHIYKITQNNKKEYDFHIRKNRKNHILTLCCNPSFPYTLLSTIDKDNFDTPPAFCMLLRKYVQGGEIINIKQINGKNNNVTLERIIDFSIKNLSDNGDINIYHIIIELMGKYSNIILCNNDYKIIDLINKIEDNSNNRSLLPNNIYETITISKKVEFVNINFDDYCENIKKTYLKAKINNEPLDFQTIFTETFLGFSKLYIYNKFINKNIDVSNINDLKYAFDIINIDVKNIISDNVDKYYIYYDDKKIKDYHNVMYNNYDKYDVFENVDGCLLKYILSKQKNVVESFDKTELKNKINFFIEKYNKKLDINQKDLSKCENMEKYKIYGDIISSYGYNSSLINNDNLVCENYYDDNKLITIPLDMSISIQNNIKKYYDKYNKLKRTFEKVNELYIENNNKLEHLLSIKDLLDICDDKIDILNIRDELNKYFIKNYNDNNKNKHKNIKNHIILHHYKTRNGIDLYVGKNNIQNEYLSFSFASNNDTWFHIKNDTGAHVIMKANYLDVDIKDVEDAASIAGYFSNKKNENKVEVDYTLVKNLKKVKNKPPGFCIYHKNYSIYVQPKIFEEI